MPMTRNDCIWVALRCTGLVLLVIAIASLPQMVSAWSIYSSTTAHQISADIPGMAELTTTMSSVGRVALTQSLLQVALSTLAAIYFLAGAPRPFALDDWA